MRSTIVAAAWLFGALLCGCSSTDNGPPTLTITPAGTAGTVQITGPTVFSAELANGEPLSADAVAWNVTGGALSSASGLHVTLAPPPGTNTATLTAVLGTLSATVQVASAPPSLAAVAVPGMSAAVTVQYDAQDVPHIQCAQAADCLAVQGYLQARDRLFPMDFLRHVAEGRVAELIGATGLSQDLQMRVLFLTRDGKRLENELVKAIDETTRTLLDAYVGGINTYLSELKASSGALPGEYAQLPFHLTPADIEPWTEQDTLAIARLNQFQLSESLTAELANKKFRDTYGDTGTHPDPQKMAAWIRAAAPTSEQAHTLSSPATQTVRLASLTRPAGKRARPVDQSRWRDVATRVADDMAALRDRLRPFDGSVGSNNWVVSASKSSTRVAMVANDPHLSLQYPPLFHLATMTSTNPADNLNIAGGSFPGIPGALVGRGAHVGWGVTVVGYDVTDVYLEDFPAFAACPGQIPCVKFGTGATATTRPIKLILPDADPIARFKVRTAAGIVDDARTLDPKTLPVTLPPALIVVPHHGPVIGAPAGLGPTTGGTGMSFRWTGHEPDTQDLKAFYGLATATSVDTAMDALKNYATGAQNFVLADDSGNIAYDPHAFVPVRSFAVAGTQNPPWFPLVSDGTTEWGDPALCAAPTGIPASCWISDDDLPHGKNPAKGYYFTANADPTSLAGNPARGVSDDNDPLSHPPYLSYDWDDSSGFRATRIEQLMKERIAAAGTISPGDMEAIQADHVSRPGMAFAPIIAAIDESTRPAEVAAAKRILATWASNGFDCPSGVTGTDPAASAADTTPVVVQNSSGCFLFHEFLRTVVTSVFADDLVRAGQGINGLAAIKALLFMLSPAGAASASFCNNFDATTGQTATVSCTDQVALALGQAYRTLSSQVSSDPTRWTWGRVHTIRPVSLLPLVTNGYAPGPYARPGGAFTVDVGSPNLGTGGLDFAYGSGGNVRHISMMDPTKPRTRMQLPGPERDGPAAGGGPDLLGQWVKNSYFDYAFGDQITAVAVTTQTFNAQR